MRPVHPHCAADGRTLFNSSHLEIRHQAQLSLPKSPSTICQENFAQSKFTFSRSFLRGQSECLYLQDKFHQIFEEDVLQEDIRVLRTDEQGKESEERQRNFHFVNKKIKYVWDPNQDVSALFGDLSISCIFATFLLSELP